MVCTLIAHAGVSFEILKFLLLEGVEVDGAPENTQKSWTFFFSLSLSLSCPMRIDDGDGF